MFSNRRKKCLAEVKESGYAAVNGAELYYEVAGEGRPLVLVHAGICDRRMWDGQFHAFAERYRVIRYDRRGFGRTKMVAGPYSHHEDLRALLDFLRIERAFLLGCSQGGKTIINLALEHPEMAEALVLVASALGGFAFTGEEPKQWAEIEEAESAGDLARVNELELEVWVDGYGRTSQQVDPRVRELAREMNLIALSTPAGLGHEQQLEPAATDRLAELRAPTLIIIGEHDIPKMKAVAATLVKQLKGARQIVMRDAAHLPNMEKPSEFNGHVLAFLDSLAGPSAAGE
jgi:pimeloyl-ACP methyl ester carboxylesterase